jgi:hypothetical protein
MMLFNTPFPQLLKVAFLFSSLVSSHHQNAKILPKPNGPFGVSITTLQLTDPARSENPFNLTSPSARRLMISAITPTRQHQSTWAYPYMPPLTASLSEQEYTENYGFPNTTYSDLFLQVTDPQHSNNLEEWPLVLFSPAQGNTRLDYTFLASNIASHGFIVITLDHPYDGDIVEFPDQSYILGVPPPDSDDEAVQYAYGITLVDARVADISFVLDSLATLPITQALFPSSSISCPLNTSQVAMFGHSLGGSAIAEAMVNETRIVGGLDIDGIVIGEVAEVGLERPFMLFGHENNTRNYDGPDAEMNVTTQTWAGLWPLLKGWKLELELVGALHYTFSDFPTVLETLGLKLNASEEVTLLSGGDAWIDQHAEEEVGRLLKADRGLEIVVEYVVAFLELVLKGKERGVLSGPDEKFPEVVFVN